MFDFCIYAIFRLLWWLGVFYILPSLGWWLREIDRHPTPTQGDRG